MATAIKKPTSKNGKAAAPPPLVAVRDPFFDDADILRGCILEMIHGTCEEPIYTIKRYTVINNDDGTVEMVLGLRNASNDPHRYVKIRIERADS
jgi:hypothetical protein